MMSLKSRNYITICFLGFSLMLANGMIFPIMSLYAREFTSSELVIGLCGAIFWITRMFFEIPIGSLSDRLSRYKIIFSGIVVSCVSFILAAFINDIYQLMGIRALMAAGTVAFFVASLAYVADYSLVEARGKALGILQAVEFSTITIGSCLGGCLAAILGFRHIFVIGALVQLFGLVIAVACKALKEDEYRRKGGMERRSKFALQDFYKIMLIKEVALTCFAIFIVQIVDGVLFLVAPLYFRNILGMEPAEISLVIATRGVGIGIGAVLGGFLFDRLYPRMYYINYVMAFGIGGVATLLLTSTNIIMFLSLIIMLAGITYGVVYSTTPALVATFTTRHSVGTTMGLWRIFYDLGGFMSLMTLGAIAEYTGLVASINATCYLLFLCMCLFAILNFNESKKLKMKR